ncbi:MAG: hypothetical protein ACTSUB_06430, partial [Candidatus Thorarchaeota archaeon]
MQDVDKLIFNNIVETLEISNRSGRLKRPECAIIAALLIEKQSTNQPLSAGDLSEITGYSRSMISAGLSQLETLQIIEKNAGRNAGRKGRRRTTLALRKSMNELLLQGIMNSLNEFHRIEENVRQMQIESTRISATAKNLIDHFLREMEIFQQAFNESEISKV